MPLEPIELLTPRYLLTHKYPHMFNPLKVGDILHSITPDEREEKGRGYYYRSESEYGTFYNVFPEPLSQYENNFDKLPWWKGRSIEDMPDYLRSANRMLVFKVIKWELDLSGRGHWADIENPTSQYKPNSKYCTPATEQEYNDYITKQNNQ